VFSTRDLGGVAILDFVGTLLSVSHYAPSFPSIPCNLRGSSRKSPDAIPGRELHRFRNLVYRSSLDREPPYFGVRNVYLVGN